MNRHSLIPLLLLGVLAAQDPSPQPPTTLALLVGINKYAPAGPEVEFDDLGGPENDIDRARAMLEQRFRFAPDSIVTLIGPAATHRAIVRAFYEHLIQKAGPATRVVFWFSGHGSRVPDASQQDTSPRADDEPALDDTLVAYDSRAVDPSGGYDISDDELHSLLRALRSEDVLVVTDCCHSGGVLRSAREPGTRECRAGTHPLQRERIREFWPRDVKFVDDDEVDAAAALARVVHIAACGAEQKAGEIKVSRVTFGKLTWFLEQALQTCSPDATWGEIGAITRAAVSGCCDGLAQTPESAGDLTRAVFGGTGRPMPPGYCVDREGVRGLIIGAGRLHGLAPDSELRLFDLANKELGAAKVTRVTSSIAEAEWASPGTPPALAMRALPRTPSSTQAPLRVRLEPGVDPALLAQCTAATIATGDTMAECVLRRAGDELQLTGLDGRVLRRTPADAQGLAVALFRERAFRSLWSGVADPGIFALRLEVLPTAPEDTAELQIPAAALRPAGATTVVGAEPLVDGDARSGGLVRIRVHNDSDEDLYVALLAVAENREVQVLFGRDPNNDVRAHHAVERVVWVGAPRDWPADRPFVDRYLAIATARFTDFTPYESAATRGDEPTGREGNAWGIACHDLQIVSPARFAATDPEPVPVFVLAGQSNMEGKARNALFDRQAAAAATQALFAPYRDDGRWRTRRDVFVNFLDRRGPLTLGFGSPECTGVELAFGRAVGEHFAAPVLLIKTAWGGHSLQKQFRPPSAGMPEVVADQDREVFGSSYRAMIADVRSTLAHADEWFPALRGRQKRIAGFVWFQGWNDQYGGAEREYEHNLRCLIADVRKDLGAPALPIVIGVMGQNGSQPAQGPMLVIQRAQLAMNDVAEFHGTVRAVRTDALVDTAAEALYPHWEEHKAAWDAIGSDREYHYYGSAIWHLRMGDAFAAAMLELVNAQAKR